MRAPATIVSVLSILVLSAAGPAAPLPAPPSSVQLGQVVRLTLVPDPGVAPLGLAPGEEATARIARTLGRRASALGLSHVTVTPGEAGQVILELPASLATEPTLRQLTRTARLEFRWLNNIKTVKHPGARYVIALQPRRSAAERDTYRFRDARTGQSVRAAQVLAESALVLTGDALQPNARLEFDPNGNKPVVYFELNREGTAALADFTRSHVGELLAVVFDGEILAAPRIHDPISSGKGVLQGGFRTEQEAATTVRLLNGGALPVPLKIVRTELLPAR